MIEDGTGSSSVSGDVVPCLSGTVAPTLSGIKGWGLGNPTVDEARTGNVWEGWSEPVWVGWTGGMGDSGLGRSGVGCVEAGVNRLGESPEGESILTGFRPLGLWGDTEGLLGSCWAGLPCPGCDWESFSNWIGKVGGMVGDWVVVEVLDGRLEFSGQQISMACDANLQTKEKYNSLNQWVKYILLGS